MENINLAISIISDIITAVVTIGAICIAWGKMKQLAEDLKEEFGNLRNDFKELRNDFKIFEKEVNNKFGEHDKDIVGIRTIIDTYGIPGSPMEPNGTGKNS